MIFFSPQHRTTYISSASIILCLLILSTPIISNHRPVVHASSLDDSSELDDSSTTFHQQQYINPIGGVDEFYEEILYPAVTEEAAEATEASSYDDDDNANAVRFHHHLSTTTQTQRIQRNLNSRKPDKNKKPVRIKDDDFKDGVEECPWRGFKQYDSDCLDWKPWDKEVQPIGGNCITDVGIGARSCIVTSKKYICDYLRGVDPECFVACWEFHNQCCCNPLNPTVEPTSTPSTAPSITQLPSEQPTEGPSSSPTMVPSMRPSVVPSLSFMPSFVPSVSVMPTRLPTFGPTDVPTTSSPTRSPTDVPSINPSVSNVPTLKPTQRACPWDAFGGSEESCFEDETVEGILDQLCFFDPANSRMGIKGCRAVSSSRCDISDFTNMPRGCRQACVTFHTVCCCAVAERGYKIPPPPATCEWSEIEGDPNAVFPANPQLKTSDPINGVKSNFALVGNPVTYTVEGSPTSNTNEGSITIKSVEITDINQVFVGTENNARYGQSVAITLDALDIAVGWARKDNGALSDTGAVDFWSRTSVQNEFVQDSATNILYPPAGNAGEVNGRFGEFIEMKIREFLVVSAYAAGSNRGRLYFYQRDNLEDDPDRSDHFELVQQYEGLCFNSELGNGGVAIESNNTDTIVHTISTDSRNCIDNAQNVRSFKVECTCNKNVWWDPNIYISNNHDQYPNVECVPYVLTYSPTFAPTATP